MKRRMFLAQSRMNEIILYTVLVDVVLGYILKRYHGPGTVLPLALLYLMNIAVIFCVYRFWKVPIFEWDENGFIAYSISPFKKEKAAWKSVEYAGFRAIELKQGKGKLREFLIIHYVSSNGLHKTNLVPMYMVGFKDKLREDLEAFLKEKGIKPL